MTLNRNTGFHNGRNYFRATAFKLDYVAPAFFHKAIGAMNSLRDAFVVRAKNHIAYDHRSGSSLYYRFDVSYHFICSKRDCSFIAQYSHGQGIAYENNFDSRLLYQNSLSIVISCNHRYFFALILHFFQFLNCYFCHREFPLFIFVFYTKIKFILGINNVYIFIIRLNSRGLPAYRSSLLQSGRQAQPIHLHDGALPYRQPL